jgi:hypothetical protein
MSVGLPASKTITKAPRRFVRTSAATGLFVTPSPNQQVVRTGEDEGWQPFVEMLERWMQAPGKTDEDGLVYPTADAIESAAEMIGRFRSQHEKPPTRLVVDGDGGVAMRWIDGDSIASIEINEDGTGEALWFQGKRLMNHSPCWPE